MTTEFNIEIINSLLHLETIGDPGSPCVTRDIIKVKSDHRSKFSNLSNWKGKYREHMR